MELVGRNVHRVYGLPPRHITRIVASQPAVHIIEPSVQLAVDVLGEHQLATMCSGRTGTRVNGRPVAARIAATMAGVDEIVGGSPTPRSPYGACGSPSSSRSTCMVGMSRMVGIR